MDRRVKATKRDRNGNIVALCNAGEAWSPRKTTDVIKDINTNKTSYYVKQAERKKYVRVVGGKSLQTTSEEENENNLNNLPTA